MQLSTDHGQPDCLPSELHGEGLAPLMAFGVDISFGFDQKETNLEVRGICLSSAQAHMLSLSPPGILIQQTVLLCLSSQLPQKHQVGVWTNLHDWH